MVTNVVIVTSQAASGEGLLRGGGGGVLHPPRIRVLDQEHSKGGEQNVSCFLSSEKYSLHCLFSNKVYTFQPLRLANIFNQGMCLVEILEMCLLRYCANEGQTRLEMVNFFI